MATLAEGLLCQICLTARFYWAVNGLFPRRGPKPMWQKTFERKCWLEKVLNSGFLCFPLRDYLLKKGSGGNCASWVGFMQGGKLGAAELQKKHKAIGSTDRKCQWAQWPNLLLCSFLWIVLSDAVYQNNMTIFKHTLFFLLSTLSTWTQQLDNSPHLRTVSIPRPACRSESFNIISADDKSSS